LRLTDPLRFRFDFGSLSRIQDRENPNSTEWSDPRNAASSNPHNPELSADNKTSDYALITRYHDTTTNGTVMVIAGLGSYGTEAASEFCGLTAVYRSASQQGASRLGDKNLEIVIRADKINGEAGPPFLVSSRNLLKKDTVLHRGHKVIRANSHAWRSACSRRDV